jgi:hypothetical protein
MLKNRWFLAAFALVFGLVLAGCPTDNDDDDDGSYEQKTIALEKGSADNELVITLSHGEWKDSATTAEREVISAICPIGGNSDSVNLVYAGEIQSDRKKLKLTVLPYGGKLDSDTYDFHLNSYGRTEHLIDYISGFFTPREDLPMGYPGEEMWEPVEGKQGPVYITVNVN